MSRRGLSGREPSGAAPAGVSVNGRDERTQHSPARTQTLRDQLSGYCVVRKTVSGSAASDPYGSNELPPPSHTFYGGKQRRWHDPQPARCQSTESARNQRSAHATQNDRNLPCSLLPTQPAAAQGARSISLHYGSAFHTIAKEEPPPAIPHGYSTRPQGACLLPRNTLVAPRGGRRRHVRQTRERYTSWDRRAGPKRPLRSAAQHRNVDGEKPRRMRTPAADRRSEWQPDGGARKAFDRCKGPGNKGPSTQTALAQTTWQVRGTSHTRLALGAFFSAGAARGMPRACFSRQMQLTERL